MGSCYRRSSGTVILLPVLPITGLSTVYAKSPRVFRPSFAPALPCLTYPRPDHCDGTYDQYCDANRQYTNITAILQSYGATSLLSYMDTYWKDQAGNDESFWEHEWGKHGTCISTLNPNCYSGYTPQEEVLDYFNKTVQLYQGLDSYSVCSSPACDIYRILIFIISSSPPPGSYLRQPRPTRQPRSKLRLPHQEA